MAATQASSLSVFNEAPYYFRKQDVSSMGIRLEESNSKYTNWNISVVKRDDAKLVRVTGPPCRCVWVNLHGTGSFPERKEQPLTKAEFQITLREGGLPEAFSSRFPEIEQEQHDFFDYMESIQRQILLDMGRHPDIHKNWKTKELKFMGQMNEEEKYQVLLDKFIEIASETSMVKRFEDGNRYFRMKTTIARPANSKYPSRHKINLENIPPNHYIMQLQKEGLEYTPPLIFDKHSDVIDLGTNETPTVESGDIVVPTFYFKPYDCTTGGVGIRAVYSSLTLVRKFKSDESTLRKRPDYSAFDVDAEGEGTTGKPSKKINYELDPTP